MHIEALIASLVALASGPALYLAASRSRLGTLAVHVSLAAAIGALITFHLLPECVEIAGLAALFAAAAGVGGAVLTERGVSRRAHRGARGAALMALVALGLHALFDGAALSAGEHHAHAHGHGLGLAIVLHRILEGAAVWWLLKRRPRAALGALAAVGAATVVGFMAGGRLSSGLDEGGIALCQAFFGGVLLRALMHLRRPHAAHTEHR